MLPMTREWVAKADGSIGQLLGYHYLWFWAARLVGTREVEMRGRDPTGKSKTRPQLTREQVRENVGEMQSAAESMVQRVRGMFNS